MIRYVRTISDSVRAKPALFICTFLVVLGTQPSYGQQAPPKQETQQQTNEQDPPAGGPRAGRSHGIRRLVPAICCTSTSSMCRNFLAMCGLATLATSAIRLIPNKIQAAGISTFQLEEKMSQLLIQNGLVSHPQVSVFIKEQQSQPVSVVGAVAKPMRLSNRSADDSAGNSHSRWRNRGQRRQCRDRHARRSSCRRQARRLG